MRSAGQPGMNSQLMSPRDLDLTGRMRPCWILTMKTMKRSWKRGWTCPIEKCMGCLKRLSILSFHLFKLGLCWISYTVGGKLRKTSLFLTWNGHFIQIFQRQEKEEKEAEAKKESQGKKKKKALWHSTFESGRISSSGTLQLSHLLHTAGSGTRECWDATGSSIDSSRSQKSHGGWWFEHRRVHTCS